MFKCIQMEDHWKILGIVMGATGFWQVLGILAFWKNERRIKAATAENLIAKTESELLNNWIVWSQKLEQRVIDLESVVKQLREENTSLKARIAELTEDEDQL